MEHVLNNYVKVAINKEVSEIKEEAGKIFEDQLEYSDLNPKELEAAKLNFKLVVEKTKKIGLFNLTNYLSGKNFQNIFTDFFDRNIHFIVGSFLKNNLPYFEKLESIKEEDYLTENDIRIMDTIDRAFMGLDVKHMTNEDHISFKKGFTTSVNEIEQQKYYKVRKVGEGSSNQQKEQEGGAKSDQQFSQQSLQEKEKELQPTKKTLAYSEEQLFWKNSKALSLFISKFFDRIAIIYGYISEYSELDGYKDTRIEDREEKYEDYITDIMKEKIIEVKLEIVKKYNDQATNLLLTQTYYDNGSKFVQKSRSSINKFEQDTVIYFQSQNNVIRKEGKFSNQYNQKRIDSLITQQGIIQAYQLFLQEKNYNFKFEDVQGVFDENYERLLIRFVKERNSIRGHYRYKNSGLGESFGSTIDSDIQMYIKSVVQGGSGKDFFPKDIKFPKTSIENLHPLIIEALILTHPLQYSKYLQHVEWVRKLATSIKLSGLRSSSRGDINTTTTSNTTNTYSTSSSIQLLEMVATLTFRRVNHIQIQKAIQKLKKKVKNYNFEDNTFYDLKFLIYIFTTLYTQIISYSDSKNNFSVFDRSGKQERTAELKAYIEGVYYMLWPLDSYSGIHDIIDMIEKNLEEVLVIQKFKVSEKGNGSQGYDTKIYKNFEFLDFYFRDSGAFARQTHREVPSKAPMTQVLNFFQNLLGCNTVVEREEKLDEIVYPPVLTEYQFVNTYHLEVGESPNTSVTLFAGGFSDEDEDKLEYLRSYNKVRAFGEVKGVEYKEYSTSDVMAMIKELISMLKNMLKKNLNVKRVYVMINWLYDSLLDEGFYFDSSKLNDFFVDFGLKILEFSKLSIFIIKLIIWVTKFIECISNYLKECSIQATKAGKAQGWMITKYEAFDQKNMNIQGLSLGSLVAYYTATTVQERSSQKHGRSAITNITLFGSVLHKKEFLSQAEKLLGKFGSVKGKLYIVKSSKDKELYLQRLSESVRKDRPSEPLGMGGIEIGMIVDHFVKKGYVKFDEKMDYLFYLREKVKIVDCSDIGIQVSDYADKFDIVLNM